MMKYYVARLVLWAVNVVQKRRNSDTELVTNVLTNYSTILNKSSDKDDELIW